LPSALIDADCMHALQPDHLHRSPKPAWMTKDAEAASARHEARSAVKRSFGPYFYYLIHKKGSSWRTRAEAVDRGEFITYRNWASLALFVLNVPC